VNCGGDVGDGRSDARPGHAEFLTTLCRVTVILAVRQPLDQPSLSGLIAHGPPHAPGTSDQGTAVGRSPLGVPRWVTTSSSARPIHPRIPRDAHGARPSTTGRCVVADPEADRPAGPEWVEQDGAPDPVQVGAHFLPISSSARASSEGRVRQVERLRGRVVLPFAFRLLRALEVGGDGDAVFRTSSTTSCHQCSAGALSSPLSR
jgi:hypothetical protein